MEYVAKPVDHERSECSGTADENVSGGAVYKVDRLFLRVSKYPMTQRHSPKCTQENKTHRLTQ